MSLLRICCRCRLVMGVIECAEVSVTHGYCPECLRDVVIEDPECGAMAREKSENALTHDAVRRTFIMRTATLDAEKR